MKKLYLFLTIVLIVLLIVHGADAVFYVKDALTMCCEMIIPSLFPFFVCSGILIYSGFCSGISKIFAPVMKPLFNINENGASAFVLGIISGYPLGAVTACQLYEAGYISKSETERLLAFCNNSGPLFILGSVGIGLYGGIEIGVMLYCAHIIGAVLVGICMRGYSADKHIAPNYRLSVEEKSISEIFGMSLNNAANSMLTICAAVVFFSVASRLFIDIIPFEVPSFIYGIFEFSSGNKYIAEDGYNLAEKLVLSSVITGFAGLSVHMQVLSKTAAKGLSMKPYITGKIMHGLFSGAAAAVIWKIKNADFKNISFNLSSGFTMASMYLIISILTVTAILIIYKMILRKEKGGC